MKDKKSPRTLSPELKDFDKLMPMKIVDETDPKTAFDATAFFSRFERTNDVTFLDEMVINGITGETFTNG